MVSVSSLEHCLHQVADPEVPALSVMDLGIVRSVRLEDGVCQVDLSPTYTGCPATERIERDVREALEALVGAGNVRIRTVLDPPWTTDWISDEGWRSGGGSKAIEGLTILLSRESRRVSLGRF